MSVRTSALAVFWLLIASPMFSSHIKAADHVADVTSQDISLDEAFARGLASANEEKRTNHAAEFGCTELFSDFGRHKTIEPYIQFFQRNGLQPIQVDQNQRHFAYVELSQQELSSRGYRNFRQGDRLVLVFETNSAASAEITSFSARLFAKTVS